jgi:murein DD-endopeptidase MepM/ murein hydrolase activator NlpD
MRPKFALAVALAALVPMVWLHAQTADEIRTEISSHNAQIEELNKEISAYEKQLVEIGEQKQTLQSTLNGLDISRKQITAQINVTKNNISTTQLQIQELTGSIEEKQASINGDTRALAQAINRMNEVETTTFVEQMLGSGSVSEFWDELEANRVFQDAVQEHIQSLTKAKEVLTVDREASEKKRRELEQQRRTLAAEQESLDINRREQQSLLTQTKSQESNYQKLLEEKKAAKIQFEQTLNELESKLEYSLDPSRLPPAGKGILRWPLDKVTITQYFGNTEFARSGAYSGKGHNGIDFRASIGTPVRAALSGVVEGVGNSDSVRGCYSYGKWVLVKHGNGLSTLYAHLSQANVSPGQEVVTRDILGYSGNTGYATGPHLHFSVYASNGVRIMKLGESTGKKTPCANATIPVSPLGAYLNPMDYL